MNTDDLLAVYVVLSTKGKRKRAIWTKDRLLKREQLGYTHLLRALLPYPEDVNTFLRMDENSYLELLDLVRPRIEKQSTGASVAYRSTSEINGNFEIFRHWCFIPRPQIFNSYLGPSIEHHPWNSVRAECAQQATLKQSRQHTWKHSTHP